MACPAPALLKKTVPATGLNVPPLLVQSPATLMVAAVPLSNVPDVNVIFNRLKVVVLPPTVKDPPPVLAIARLLKVCDAIVPLRFRAPVLLKVTMPAPGVKVVPVARVQSPATFIVAGAVNVPAVRVKVPFRSSWVVLPPVFSVCPVLLTVRLLKV